MIINLSELKNYLNITTTDNDWILNILLDCANDYVVWFLGRSLNASEYTEYQNGDGQRDFILSNYPVNTLTGIYRNIGDNETEDWEEVDPTKYKLEAKTGKIFLNFYKARGFQNYKIVYNAGYETIPGDLKLATLKIAGGYYNKRNTDWISSESVAGDSISFNVNDIGGDVLNILNNYRDV